MVQIFKTPEQDYDHIIRYSISEYGRDLEQTEGLDAQVALEKSQQEFVEMLPQGYQTEDHEFYTLARDSGEEVGFIWLTFEADEGRVFLSDIEIYPEYQHQGLGTEAMQFIENLARERGFQEIELSVFKHNPVGIAFYKKLRYQLMYEEESYFEMHKVLSV
jgi:ribosomal protein S18 acetylase RimI-like enzyme